MQDQLQELRELVGLLVEKRVREADVSDGSRVPHGSPKHVKDLESRIAGLVQWRDRQKRGSEARANYSRLISRLKAELASARRARAKKEGLREETGRWWEDRKLWNMDSESYMPTEEMYAKMAEEPEFKPYIDAIRNARDPKELAQAKRKLVKDDDAGKVAIPPGMWMHFWDMRRAELADMRAAPRSAADTRKDWILRTRDSSGRATARKR